MNMRTAIRHMRSNALTVLLCLIILGIIWFHRTNDQKCTIQTVSLNDTSASISNYRLETVKYGYTPWTPFFNRKGGKDLPRILFWTTIYESWYSGLTNELADELEYTDCPYRCFIANDRRLLSSSDAVVFYGRDLNLADMPQARSRGQKWVYWSLEPPPHCVSKSLAYLNNTFNWTMTYRYDSDVLDTYVTLTKKPRPTPYSMTALRELWENKSAMAVWPVGHCHTFGKREDYVKVLNKSITVDVYGSCGELKCNRDSEHSCHATFAKQYFFLISFENAVCKDYVTEKLYVTLLFDLIPVVFGGANYSAVAPPGSYIDALSFESPKHLADHLTAVAKDFNLYKSYFRWKGKYEIVPWTYYTFCNLCRKLYSEHYKQTTVYRNILHWWNTTSHCRAWDNKTSTLYS